MIVNRQKYFYVLVNLYTDNAGRLPPSPDLTNGKRRGSSRLPIGQPLVGVLEPLEGLRGTRVGILIRVNLFAESKVNNWFNKFKRLKNSGGDPDPDFFGLQGSGFGTFSQSYGSGSNSGSGSFYHQEKIVKKTLILSVL
jgi:hypothetical protein